VPWGRATVPRTCWSLFLESIPRWTCTSMDESNFVFAVFFTSAIASSGE